MTREQTDTFLGRDDVLWVDNTGAVTTWTNLRGETTNSLAPFWKYAGVTHSGVGVGVTQYWQVSFANVAGHKEWITYPDYFGVGDDYMALFTGNGGSNPLPSGETSLNNENLAVKLYFNTGKGGGTRQKGDGDRYCDMRGIGAGKRYKPSFLGILLTQCQTTTSGWTKMELLHFTEITTAHHHGYNTV